MQAINRRLRLAVVFATGTVAVGAFAWLWIHRADASAKPDGRSRPPSPAITKAVEVLRASPVPSIPKRDPIQGAIAIGQPELHSRITAFNDWLAALRDHRHPALAEGVRLAVARRAALKTLIQVAPEEALKQAVPRAMRSVLPAEVMAELETPVDAFGRFQVMQVCATVGGAIIRQAEIAGQRFDVYTYGQRQSALTKNRLALHGIAIDDQLAVADIPYRRVEDGEPAAGAGLVVAVGDSMQAFSNEAALTEWSRARVEFESVPNPDATGEPGQTVAAATSDWVFGLKTVLWIRVEFSDDPGLPATDQDIAFSMNAVNEYYADVSRNLTSFRATTLPGVLRLSTTKAAFNAGTKPFSQLSDEAVKLARDYDATNGNSGLYNPDRYDRYVVAFKHVESFKQNVDTGDGRGPQPDTWSGWATVGGKGLWLNGPFRFSQFGNYQSHLLAHELGHNQGLFHSHAWIPSVGRESAYFKTGFHCEYGDFYDVMGGCDTTSTIPVPTGHFNVKQKSMLGYLAPVEIQQVTTAGIYRINRSDSRQASGVQALQIAAGSAYDYWLEYAADTSWIGEPRFSPKYAARSRNGVRIHWGKRPAFTPGPGTYLLDATPAQVTKFGWVADGPLGIGESFKDPDFNITIAPVAVGGSAPSEYIDVEVTFGAAARAREGPRFTSSNLVYDDPTGKSIIGVGADVSIPVFARGYVKVQLWGNGQLLAEKSGDNPSFTWTPQDPGTTTLQLRAFDASGRDYSSIPIPVEVDLPNWQWKAPSLRGNTLTAVHYGLGRWYAVGEQGTILTSADGRSWSVVPVTTNATFRSVTSDGQRLIAAIDSFTDYNIAVLASNAYWTTTDGSNWQGVFVDVGQGQTQSAVYGNGTWVLSGIGGQIYSSTDAKDGPSWKSSGSTTYSIQAAAYGAGRWIAVGLAGAIHTSTDGGKTWTRINSPTTQLLQAVAYNGSRWVAVGGGGTILSSSDGIAWSLATPGVPVAFLRGVSVIGGQFVAVGSGGLVLASTDGLNWITQPQSRKSDLYAIAENGGMIVAVGEDGEILAGTSLTSLSAIDSSPRMGTVSALAVSGNSVVMVGGGVDFFAAKPLTSIMTFPEAAGAQLATGSSVAATQTGIAVGRGLFVSVGFAGSIFSSSDGVNWTARNSGVARKLNAAAIGPAAVVVVGDGGSVVTTSDAVAWGIRASGTAQNLNAITFGNGQFVAVGDGGTVLTSTDGATWTARASGVGARLNAVAWSDSAGFAAVGNAGTVLTSSDGVSWRARPLSGSDQVNLTGIAGTPGGFAVLAGNHLLVSADGSAWTRAGSGINSPTAIAYGNGALWIAGSNGRLVQHVIGPGVPAIAGAPANPGRLINLSILTALANPGDSVTVGIVLGGAGTSGTKSVLLRAGGPALALLGVAGFLPDPKLELFSGSAIIASNDDWGGASSLAASFAQVGAFPYAAVTSRDAAIYNTAMTAGGYTARISGAGGTTGTVIAELYDSTPAIASTATTPRLINMSVLKQFTVGENLTAGFVIGGSTSKQVLIRAIGPALGAAPFNIGGAMADPKIDLFAGPTVVATNDNWNTPVGTDAATPAQLTTAFAQVGAFAIPANSKDAVLLATIAPGGYTAQVSGVNNTGGVAIVEIYEIP